MTVGYLSLYFAFLRCGLYTFGGGYAMLPMMERIIARKKNWATAEEIAGLFALGQILPGIVAVNAATFIGNKQKGLLGGVVAAFGVITPSLTIVTLIAAFFDSFMEIEIVRNALSGVFVVACALIISAVYKLFKTCIKISDKTKTILPLLTIAGAFGAVVFVGISPVIIVITGVLLGILFSLIEARQRRRKA